MESVAKLLGSLLSWSKLSENSMLVLPNYCWACHILVEAEAVTIAGRQLLKCEVVISEILWTNSRLFWGLAEKSL